MNINIAPHSNTVVIDGEGQTVDLSSLDRSIQGIHWDGQKGDIAYWDPQTRRMLSNQELTSFSDYQWVIDAFNAAKQQIAENIAAMAISNATELVLLQRNTLLKSSDWTQLPDVPLTDEQKAQWSVYRQALRDITDQQGFPENIVWPTEPA